MKYHSEKRYRILPSIGPQPSINLLLTKLHLGFSLIPTFKSRAGVRADEDGTVFADYPLIIIAAKPLCPS